jgi:hypothetical protein
MTDINLKTLTPDTSLPTTGFLFGADSQATANPSVYSTQTVATTLLGSTSLTGDTLTASAPVLDLAQTWNNGAVTFTGIKYNVDTTTYNQSAAASLLMDLQVGAASKFSVRKDGSPVVPSTIGYRISNFTSNAIGQVGPYLGLSNPSSGVLVFPDSNPIGVGYGQVALGLYGVRVISSGAFSFTSGAADGTSDTFITRKNTRILQLGEADAATALAQTLSVQSVVAGAITNPAGADFTITGSQGLGSGAGGSIIFKVAPAGSPANPAQNALRTALTITPFALGGDITITGGQQSGSSNDVCNLILNNASTLSHKNQITLSSVGTARWAIGNDILGNKNDNLYFYSGSNGDMPFYINGAAKQVIVQGGAGHTFGFSGSTGITVGTLDVIISREAAGVLGIRGTSTSVGGAIGLIEQTAPAAPAANGVRIYAEDNGSGKTRLMALFATGVAQQIAIEP